MPSSDYNPFPTSHFSFSRIDFPCLWFLSQRSTLAFSRRSGLRICMALDSHSRVTHPSILTTNSSAFVTTYHFTYHFSCTNTPHFTKPTNHNSQDSQDPSRPVGYHPPAVLGHPNTHSEKRTDKTSIESPSRHRLTLTKITTHHFTHDNGPDHANSLYRITSCRASLAPLGLFFPEKTEG